MANGGKGTRQPFAAPFIPISAVAFGARCRTSSAAGGGASKRRVSSSSAAGARALSRSSVRRRLRPPCPPWRGVRRRRARVFSVRTVQPGRGANTAPRFPRPRLSVVVWLPTPAVATPAQATGGGSPPTDVLIDRSVRTYATPRHKITFLCNYPFFLFPIEKSGEKKKPRQNGAAMGAIDTKNIYFVQLSL